MFRFGYCSNCTAHVALELLQDHAADEHPGQVIYATLYRPDPAQLARNLSVADEMMASRPAESKSSTVAPDSAGHSD